MPAGQQIVADRGDETESQIDALALADVHIAGVEPVLRRACFIRGMPHGGSSETEFEFEADMAETGRSDDGVQVRFSLSFGKMVTGQHCELEGRANFHFTHLDPRFDLRLLGTELQNDMAIELYRSYYDVIYLIHDTLGMDIPSPWIVHDVALSTKVIEEE